MGIDSTLAYLLGTTARRFNLHGALCTLGVQDFRTTPEHFETVLTAAGLPPARPGSGFYGRLGFDRVESVDVSDFEGCTHLVDLNVAGVPAYLHERFDAVYNGGTLEHVFDTRTALRNLFELLTIGGVAIHAAPASGWVDHGFYQFSPTLLVDYYAANQFDILEAVLLEALPGEVETCVVRSYVPGSPGGVNVSEFCGRWMSYVTVRKTTLSTWDVAPRQSYYAAIHSGGASPASRVEYRPPFRIENGVPVRSAVPRVTLPRAVRGEGFEWIVRVPQLRSIADDLDSMRSQLILFEDGEPIGPPHALHSDIRAHGAGRYSHWTDAIHFAPARNDDAADHEYSYLLHDPASAPTAGGRDRNAGVAQESADASNAASLNGRRSSRAG